MMVRPNPAPELAIKSVDGTTLDSAAGTVTIIRPADAPASFNVVVKAHNFRALAPAQLYIWPDNGPHSVLNATIDNRAGADPAEHTFVATVPPNIRTTLQVMVGKSLPGIP
jgi:hypothetical protein